MENQAALGTNFKFTYELWVVNSSNLYQTQPSNKEWYTGTHSRLSPQVIFKMCYPYII